MSIAESKAELRRTIRAARAERTPDARAAAAASIAARALTLLPERGGSVSAYLSMPTEPGTHALVAMLLAAGHSVLVPRITGRDLEWVRLTAGSELRRGPMGIREPDGDAEPASSLAALDVLLLPGLAVDRVGRRLGQGGGFYDRTLAAVPTHADGGPLRAMLLFDDEVRDVVPADEHDCVVDAAVTPSGVHRFPENR